MYSPYLQSHVIHVLPEACLRHSNEGCVVQTLNITQKIIIVILQSAIGFVREAIRRKKVTKLWTFSERGAGGGSTPIHSF